MTRKLLPETGFIYIPLGGSGEFGRHCTLYGCDGKYIMVDCGMGFAHKTTPGVDLLLPDIGPLLKQKASLKGIVLTHGHFDHIGALGHIWPQLQVPIYTTKLTKALAEATLREYNLETQAPITLCDHDAPLKIGPFDLTFHEAAHSIPEGNMLRVQCKHGSVVHATDWKLDKDPLLGAQSDLELMKAWCEDPSFRAWVGDSTNAMDHGFTESESDLPPHFERLFGQAKGAVFVTTLSSNLTRVRSIALAAKACGKQVVLTGFALRKMVSAARQIGLFDDVQNFVDGRDFKQVKRKDCVVICSGSQGERNAALRRIAQQSHPYIKASAGDTVLFSARVIPGNETEIYDLQNTLLARGIHIVTPKDDTVYVSSHAKQGELEEMYKAVRPSCVIPCHGDEMHLQAHINVAKACGVETPLLVRNGDIVRLDDPQAPYVPQQVDVRVIGVDGNRALPLIGALEIRERYKLQIAGHMLIVVSEDQHVLLKLRGLFDEGERRKHLAQVEDLVADCLDGHDRCNRLEQEIRRRVKAYMMDVAGKSPIIDVVLTWEL